MTKGRYTGYGGREVTRTLNISDRMCSISARPIPASVPALPA